MTQEESRGRGRSRRLWGVLVLAVAVAWSVYLVAADLNDDSGTFALIIQVMGSIGILYALFLVTRPQKRGVLEILGVFKEDVVPKGSDHSEPSSQAARWAVITITIALALGGLLYRLAQDNYLHQSAAFFIGVPAVLAITLALTPKAKSATGMIVKGVSLALLLSGVVLAEGFICILMAAPLFYLVGIAIGIPIDRARRRKRGEGRIYSIFGAALLILSLEGVTPLTSFSAREVVSVTRTIDASATSVERALARTPRFDESLPFYLRLGFPRPVAAEGSGLAVGDRRTILFGDESPMEPMTNLHEHGSARGNPRGQDGALELEITTRRDGLVVFEPVHDATAFTHWITWGRSLVRWEAIDDDTTEVTWTLHFERELSPSLYFGPFQRYAGHQAAGYLIDAIAMP